MICLKIGIFVVFILFNLILQLTINPVRPIPPKVEKNKSDLFVIQNENDFGFFNLKIKDKVIVGEFIANNGKIVDAFEIRKSM